MSINPGVTNNPETFTTFVACEAGMAAATRATLPLAIATSMRASMLFLGSMTRPPCSRRS
jgi:hypothetical protein